MVKMLADGLDFFGLIAATPATESAQKVRDKKVGKTRDESVT